MNDVNANNGLTLVRPAIAPALDPNFRPAVLANRAFRAACRARPVPVQIALERADGSISRFDTQIVPADQPAAAGNFVYLERLLKFYLWSRGGWRIHFA